jgi:predicted RNA binding protein YcfA (HicA-like mRNA interferase family)
MSGRAQTMELVKQLRKQGFNVERSGSGHWKVTHPERDGMVVIAFSPRKTGMHLTLKRLRKIGHRP